MTTQQMIIRMPDELKSKASRLAQAEGKNLSALVRELLEQYVRDRDMNVVIDDLWDRIGSRLKTSGSRVTDIEEAIRTVRAKK